MAKEDIKKDPEQKDQPNTANSAFMVNGELFDTVPTPMYGQRLGSLVKISSSDWLKVSVRAPGFMRINYSTTCGSVDSPTAPLNLAAQILYKKVQDAMKNRNLPYQKIDVLMNLLAADSIRIAYNDIARMYEALPARDKWSEYTGPELIRAMGYDFDSCFNARPQIREHLIMWKSILDKYPLPKVFNFVSLHEQMGRNIYVDTISNKAQKYIFVPKFLYTYENVDTHARLKYRPFHYGDGDAAGVDTWGTIRDRMNAMINAMIDSTNFDVISAAILSTFADTPTVEVAVPGETGDLVYAADPAALNAIMNLITIPHDWTAIQQIEIQDNGRNFIHIPEFVIDGGTDRISVWLPDAMNLLKDCPTSAEMVNYMRWAPSGVSQQYGVDDSDQPKYELRLQHWGSELISELVIYTVNDICVETQYGNGAKETTPGTVTMTNIGARGNTLRNVALISAFKSHPIIYDGGLPITDWNYIAEVPEKEPYFTALLWKAFVENYG